MENYNKTQLNPDSNFEKHVYHRDQFAHYLRWSHVLKRAEIGMKILDFGCGSGNLLEVLYRNRFKPDFYAGFDIRKKTIESNREKWKDLHFAKFDVVDLVEGPFPELNNTEFDIVCSFEVAEHVYRPNVSKFLDNFKSYFSQKTIGLISTPCFDEKVGPADNHVINGVIGEMTYSEFESLLSERFKIKNKWGTFASIKDYKHKLDQYEGLKKIYDRLHEYYDSNILSCLMAPLFPEQSRNCMWEISL